MRLSFRSGFKPMKIVTGILCRSGRAKIFRVRGVGVKSAIRGRLFYYSRCKRCGYDESITANTIFHGVKMPLLKAFHMLFRITAKKKGMSTIELGTEVDVQLSIDYTKEARYHFELAKELQALRKRGVLIIGSGNMVHNLRMVNWQKLNEPGFAYDWVTEINETFKTLILQNNAPALIHYAQLETAAKLAIPTPEHYISLIYTMGLRNEKEGSHAIQ